jgi:glycine/D-amino acid oxidase-like deaminating enzyme
MKSVPFWIDPDYRAGPSLHEEIVADYLIVGGGISGLSAAHALLVHGVPAERIVLIEKGVVGMGSTGHSAGMLIPEPENHGSLWWGPLVKHYGLALTKEYRKAHLQALQTVQKIIKEGHIDCGATSGDLIFLARDEETMRFLEKDAQARAALGERPIEGRGKKATQEVKGKGFVYSVRTKAGISVNPAKFAQGFGGYLRRKGVRVYEHTPLLSVRGNLARTQDASIRFKKIIYARGASETRYPGLERYISSMAVTQPLTEKQLSTLHLRDKDMFINEKPGSYCDYGKITSDNRLLVGFGDIATKDRDVQTVREAHMHAIRSYIKKVFPQVPLRISHGWSGVYTVTHGMSAIVEVRDRVALINGAGDQLGSMVAAQHAVAKLLGKPHPLDGWWPKARARRAKMV